MKKIYFLMLKNKYNLLGILVLAIGAFLYFHKSQKQLLSELLNKQISLSEELLNSNEALLKEIKTDGEPGTELQQAVQKMKIITYKANKAFLDLNKSLEGVVELVIQNEKMESINDIGKKGICGTINSEISHLQDEINAIGGSLYIPTRLQEQISILMEFNDLYLEYLEVLNCK